MKAFFDAFHPLDPALLADYQALWEPVEYKRKTMLTQAGQTERYLYFVREGYQRSYYVKEGKEHVIAFTYPPSFSGIPESFITQTPSTYFLETLTASKMLRISYEAQARMLEQHRPIETLLRKVTEAVLIGFAQRHYEMLAYSMEERFRAFTSRSPHLLNAIPHKHIASYLRIDPTNFSKLMGRLKI